MIIVLNKQIEPGDKERIVGYLKEKGFRVREIQGESDTVLGAVGSAAVDHNEIRVLPGVAEVIPISKPYKLASREFKKTDTVINIGGVKIGGNRFCVMGGPCAVENAEQIDTAARIVSESGGVILRGGAFKPRTSPYAFQGLGEEGLKLMKAAGSKYGLPIATEIVSEKHIPLMEPYVDIYQIGARNMQNFELLKAVGKLGKPVMLKRGLSATMMEWLMAAEYLLANGTDDVILCERGIRTFETETRNTLDLSMIPVLKKVTHLPIIVDPSHGTGRRDSVIPMAMAAAAAGADGVIVEMHPDPEQALSDGAQSLYPEQFEKMVCDLRSVAAILNKELARIPQPAAEPETETVLPAATHPHSVAFQGEHGAFSEIALKKFFDTEKYRSLPCKTFHDVFESVLKGEAEFGIVPIENSLAGSIHTNYDLLLRYPDLTICGETKIRVSHNLIGIKTTELKNIQRVYSHPQALGQCARFIEEHGYQTFAVVDTSGSVAMVKEMNDPQAAAIAGEAAAEYWDMKILKPGIESDPKNFTRFYIVCRKENKPKIENPNKVSLVFSTKDEPGALLKILKIFADGGLNLSKLESRPIFGKPWEYLFYAGLDTDGKTDTKEIFENVKAHSEFFKVLGSFKKMQD